MANVMAGLVRYGGNGFFIGISPSGHATVLETDGKRNAATTPFELLLIAVGGCMASDVVEILQKREEQITGYHVQVQGERRQDPPRSFAKINLHHVIVGHRLSEDAIHQAIESSNSKFCSVAATLRPTAEVTVSYEIVEQNESVTK
jgi:putative redox protein